MLSSLKLRITFAFRMLRVQRWVVILVAVFALAGCQPLARATLKKVIGTALAQELIHQGAEWGLGSAKTPEEAVKKQVVMKLLSDSVARTISHGVGIEEMNYMCSGSPEACQAKFDAEVRAAIGQNRSRLTAYARDISAAVTACLNEAAQPQSSFPEDAFRFDTCMAESRLSRQPLAWNGQGGDGASQ